MRTQKDLLFLLAGLAAAVFFVWTYPSVYPDAAMRDLIPRVQAESRAQELLTHPVLHVPKGIHQMIQEVRFQENRNWILFHQESYGLAEGNRKAGLRGAHQWHINWKSSESGNISLGGSGRELTFDARLRLHLDAHGKLLLWEVSKDLMTGKQEGGQELVSSISLDSARQIVHTVLHTEVDAQVTETSSRPLQDGTSTGYEFAYESAADESGFQWKISVTLLNGRIVRFERTGQLPTNFVPYANRYANTYHSVRQLILLVSLSCVVLIFFIGRIAKGRLDLKLAIFASIVGFVSYGGRLVSLSIHEVWWVLLLILLFGAGFWALMTGIATTTAASVAHDVWSEKYRSLEGLRHGHVVNWKTGSAIVRGLVYALLVLAGVSFVLTVFPRASFSWLIDEDRRFDGWSGVEALTGAMATSFLQAHTAYLLILSWLARHIRKPALLPMGAVLGLVVGGFFTSVEPLWLSLIISALTGLLLTAILLRYDFLTLMMTLLFLQLLQHGMATFFAGDLTQIAILGLGMGAIVGFGVTGLMSRNSGDHVDEYEPDYVRHQRERERMEREFEIARHIQTTMLCCKTPQHPQIEIASICDPAHEVGGDYYDFFRFEDDRIGVVIGDVSGKGVSAAFYMTLVKGILQTQARVTPDSPRDTLIRLNEIFCENAEKSKFISMLYAVFDLQKGTMRLARAGHNPLLFRKSQHQAVEPILPPGNAIGLSRSSIFADSLRETEISIRAGDLFIFYTDGFSEAMNKKGEEFGEHRIQEALQTLWDQPPSMILKNLQSNVHAFTGDVPQHDDMTMIVMKLK